MLQETAPDAALCAADNLPATNHKFVPGWRNETGRINAIAGVLRLLGIGRKYGGHSKIVVCEAQSFGHSSVISINGIAKVGRIVRNHGIREFVIVQHRTATGRTVNYVDTICAAIVHVHGLLDVLIPAKRDRRTAPAIEADDSPRG